MNFVGKMRFRADILQHHDLLRGRLIRFQDGHYALEPSAKKFGDQAVKDLILAINQRF